MKELAQKNQRGIRARIGLAGLLAALDTMFRFLPSASIGSGAAPSAACVGWNRAVHKAERQRIRYARMHNRKGSHV